MRVRVGTSYTLVVSGGTRTLAVKLWKHVGPTVGRLERLRRLGRVFGEQICPVCSAVSEAFGTARTVSGPVQLAKSVCVRVCVSVCACAPLCVRACVCPRVRVCVRACVFIISLSAVDLGSGLLRRQLEERLQPTASCAVCKYSLAVISA